MVGELHDDDASLDEGVGKIRNSQRHVPCARAHAREHKEGGAWVFPISWSFKVRCAQASIEEHGPGLKTRAIHRKAQPHLNQPLAEKEERVRQGHLLVEWGVL